MVEPIEFYVINYNGERIPVIPNIGCIACSMGTRRNCGGCAKGYRNVSQRIRVCNRQSIVS